jgi:hypothetical protein
MMGPVVSVIPTQTLHLILGDLVGRAALVGVLFTILSSIIGRFRLRSRIRNGYHKGQP